MVSTLFGSESLVTSAVDADLEMRLPNRTLKLSWTHSSLTADFIAETFASQLGQSSQDRNRLRSDVSFLANELIENAVKFGSEGEIEIQAAIDGVSFRLAVTNTAVPSMVPEFKDLLGSISARQPEELLLEQLEATATDAQGNASGLGILTLLSDYGAEMAWVIDEDGDDDRVEIATHASIRLPNNKD